MFELDDKRELERKKGGAKMLFTVNNDRVGLVILLSEGITEKVPGRIQRLNI
jgi:hypothetical protein